MKAKVLRSRGYSFKEEVVGNTYEVAEIDEEAGHVRLIIDHEHDSNLKYPPGTEWIFDLKNIEIIEETPMTDTNKVKVQILDGSYSFKDQLVGKVFDAERIYRGGALAGYNVFIHFSHGEEGNEFVPRNWTFVPSMVVEVDPDTRISDNRPLPKLQVDQVVVLNPNSKYATDEEFRTWNPLNTRGVIERVVDTDTEYYYHVRWNNGLRNDYDEEDLIIVKPSKNAPRRQRKAPEKRKQTIVYILYKDGKDYQIRRAKHVVVSAEHQALHVDTSSKIGGIEIRQNTSVPFDLIDAVRVSTPDGEFCYYFTNGKLTGSAREFNERLPFKTQTH